MLDAFQTKGMIILASVFNHIGKHLNFGEEPL